MSRDAAREGCSYSTGGFIKLVVSPRFETLRPVKPIVCVGLTDCPVYLSICGEKIKREAPLVSGGIR